MVYILNLNYVKLLNNRNELNIYLPWAEKFSHCSIAARAMTYGQSLFRGFLKGRAANTFHEPVLL